jgi:hypothetical protein
MDDEGPPLALRVVRRVAAVLGRDTTELPPMYDHVDLEAVERLVEESDADANPVVVRFEYEGVAVRIEDSDVTVADPAGDDDDA